MNNLANAQCLDCESHNVKEALVEQRFQYGTDAAAVMLKAMVPVLSCVDCGYEFFDERGEQARHAAVCRHLGVHTPEELAALRRRAGLSRAEGCALTGFGIASWQRWEAGVTPPNTSSDRLLYLLQFPENINRLRERRRHVESLSNDQTQFSEGVQASIRVREHSPRRCFKHFERFAKVERVLSQADSWVLRK